MYSKFLRFNVKRIKTTRTISEDHSTTETAFYEECEIENAIHCNIKQELHTVMLLKTQKNNRKYQCSEKNDVGFSGENAETVTVVRRGTVTVVGEWRG
ncbi:hypothetical protein MTR_2g063833 [Medicago truncatula]|uniref:Uncharacterized protein n=1 Tax=Medicago truncatula TaxID=3880 RepID=A0A072V8Q9_MEDTR|nr:hypothetical protein MTR_2g063833 [Medicago truncatula]